MVRHPPISQRTYTLLPYSALFRSFCEELDLIFSPAYLRPGFAFGGSGLPKQLRAVAELAKSPNLQLPMMTSILTSNDSHIDRAFEMVQRRGRGSEERRVGKE